MVADRTTKALLFVIALCLVVLCAHSLSGSTSVVYGAATGPNSLQFSADKDRFYFFDPGTMKVYSYPAVGGNPQSAVQLDRIGGELRPAPTY